MANVDRGTLTLHASKFLRRVQDDLMQLRRTPPEGVSCRPTSSDDLDLNLHPEGISLEILLEAPQTTPYAGGVFRVAVNIPRSYPFCPPHCRFLTPVYHPNIDSKSGRICLSILKEGRESDRWRANYTLAFAFSALRQLLQQPNPEDPLDADIAAEFIRNRGLFEHNARSHTLQHARPQKAPEPASTSVAAPPISISNTKDLADALNIDSETKHETCEQNELDEHDDKNKKSCLEIEQEVDRHNAPQNNEFAQITNHSTILANQDQLSFTSVEKIEVPNIRLRCASPKVSSNLVSTQEKSPGATNLILCIDLTQSQPSSSPSSVGIENDTISRCKFKTIEKNSEIQVKENQCELVSSPSSDDSKEDIDSDADTATETLAVAADAAKQPLPSKKRRRKIPMPQTRSPSPGFESNHEPKKTKMQFYESSPNKKKTFVEIFSEDYKECSKNINHSNNHPNKKINTDRNDFNCSLSSAGSGDYTDANCAIEFIDNRDKTLKLLNTGRNEIQADETEMKGDADARTSSDVDLNFLPSTLSILIDNLKAKKTDFCAGTATTAAISIEHTKSHREDLFLVSNSQSTETSAANYGANTHYLKRESSASTIIFMDSDDNSDSDNDPRQCNSGLSLLMKKPSIRRNPLQRQ